MVLQNLQNDFKGSNWKHEIDVRDFIQANYEPYDGDESFLTAPSARTTMLWDKLSEMFKVEREKGVYDAETKLPQTLDTYGAGYIDKDNEVIVGLQTDAPLKRGIFPRGGIRMVESALKAYGYELDPATKDIYTKYCKTHNEGVFSAYNDDIKAARHAHIITGLPDAYGRGRIIGDYRRVALYGTANLIEEKKRFHKRIDIQEFTEEIVRCREEITDQIKALKQFERMCASYGFDVSKPATNAREAVQWTYFGYLGAVKDQDGAAMSLGRVCAFLDIYIQRDLKRGILTEEEAQELIDQMIMKLRIVRFLRTPEYNDLFSGDPIWATAVVGGMGVDGRSMVTKTAYRFLHTLYNMGPSPEPNLTILWSERLPEPWKLYCAKVSIDTSALQYENDDLMRPELGDDYGIACCVSPMKIGKQMQFFGARANLAKCMLYAINGGRDEVSGEQIGPRFSPITGDYLTYEEFWPRFEQMMRWLAKTYVNGVFGMSFMKIRLDNYIVTDDGIYLSEASDPAEELKKYQDSISYFIPYVVGCLIAALGRVHLQAMIDCCGDNFLYCDTDSVFFSEPEKIWPRLIDMDDKDAEERRKCGLPICFDDIKGRPHEMGRIEDEGSCGFKSFGAKKYITVEDGKLACTIAGVPKKAGSVLIGTPERFQLGFNFKGADTGKNCLWYNPPLGYDLHDSEGRTIPIHYNVAMLPCDYLLSMSSDYTECLSIEGNFHWQFKEADKYGINEEDL